MAIYALLAQNRDSWAGPCMNVGRGDVMLHVETQLRIQTGIANIEYAIVLLLRAFRVVAQLLHPVSGFRPGAMQVNALFRKYRLIVAQKPDFISVINVANDKTQVTQTLFRQYSQHIPAIASLYLDHCTQFFVKQNRQDTLHESSTQCFRFAFAAIDICRQRIETQLIQVDAYARVSRKSHLA